MFVDITDKTELLNRSSDVFKLFSASFGKNISGKEWRWFYIDNPIGNPYISLFYDGPRLLGHYAAIPTLLRYRDESFVGYRSMTTMVHPIARGRRLFIELAERVYTRMQDDKVALVYGFPNKNAVHGRIKYLNWKVLPADFIFDMTGKEIKEFYSSVRDSKESISWDCRNVVQKNWRSSIPGFETIIISKIIIKNYNGLLNILNLDVDDVGALTDSCVYRLLIPSEHVDLLRGKEPVFEYQFGFRAFSNNYKGARFKRELILSDVF